MAQLLGLSQEQVARICPLFPKERGVKRVDDRKVFSGIIPVTRSSLCRVHAPTADGPHKPLYNRCRRWSDKGVFDRIFSELSASDATEPSDAIEPEALMIDATNLKAHRTASNINKGA